MHTALGTAALNGHTEIVSILLSAGADVNYKNREVGNSYIIVICSSILYFALFDAM